MGQATIDLPDPAQKPSLDALPSADDLLVKMAGEEIDRLLAEADKGQFKAGEQCADVEAVGSDSTAAEAAERSAAAAENDAESSRQLDKLFNQISESEVAREVEAAVQQPQASKPVEIPPLAAPGAERSSAPEINVAEQTGALEREALTAQLPEPAADESLQQMDARNEGNEGQAESLPWFVRVLEWINLPLAGIGDEARAMLGKIAIVTLINALALLAYALLRR